MRAASQINNEKFQDELVESFAENMRRSPPELIVRMYGAALGTMHAAKLFTPQHAVHSLIDMTDEELTAFTAAFNTFLQARAEEKASSK